MEQEKIVLWRGDIEKINRFSMQKVDKTSALVGPGIYLTDSKKVAETYRSKGRSKGQYLHRYRDASSDIILFSSNNSSLSHAQLLEVGFEGYVAYKWQQLHPGQKMPGKHEKEWGALAKSLRLEWRSLVRTGRIDTKSLGTSAFNSKSLSKQWKSRVTMNLNSDKSLGHLSRFVFDKEEFESKILNISIPITDRRVLRILYDARFLFRVITAELRYEKRKQNLNWDSFISFREYCEEMQYAFICRGYNEEALIKLDKEFGHRRTIYSGGIVNLVVFGSFSAYINPRERGYLAFIQELKAIGYRGFEYSGGSFTRSSLKHRAFSIWDENYINAHRADYTH